MGQDNHQSYVGFHIPILVVGFKSLAWIDVKKHKEMIDAEIDAAKFAIKQSKPSKSEMLYDELGFEDE